MVFPAFYSYVGQYRDVAGQHGTPLNTGFIYGNNTPKLLFYRIFFYGVLQDTVRYTVNR